MKIRNKVIMMVLMMVLLLGISSCGTKEGEVSFGNYENIISAETIQDGETVSTFNDVIVALGTATVYTNYDNTTGDGYLEWGTASDGEYIKIVFVDNEVGAACATGMGEAVIRIAGSAIVVELMRNGMSPNQACKEAVDRVIKKHKNLTNLQVGFLALNKNGETGAYSVYSGFDYAVHTKSQNILVDAKFDRE